MPHVNIVYTEPPSGVRRRTKSGLAAAKAAGRTGGRPTLMTDTQVEHARSLRTEGRSVTEIADLFNVSKNTIYRVTDAAAS